MSRDIEQHIFRLIQQRQRLFHKIIAASVGISLALAVLSFAYRLPLFLALLPLSLTGPFAWNVITARCPHCGKPLHRLPFGVFQPLDRCRRCGFR